MSIQTDGRLAALASGARLLARAGTLDEQLDGLAAAACTVSGAASSVIYLLDGEHGVLLAGGSAGIGDLAVEPVAPLAVTAGSEAGDPVARAVVARRSEIVPVTEGMRAALAAAAGEIAAMGLVPLVTQDGTGAQEVQGLLVVGLPAEPSSAGEAADLIGGLDAIGGPGRGRRPRRSPRAGARRTLGLVRPPGPHRPPDRPRQSTHLRPHARPGAGQGRAPGDAAQPRPLRRRRPGRDQLTPWRRRRR